jgi:hypothetical protein
MKSLFLLATLIFSVSVIAQSRPTIPPGSIPGRGQIPGDPPGGWPGDHGGGWGNGGGNHGGGSSCAPEVLEGNVAATERILKAVSATADFSSATQFKSVISKIAMQKNQTTKVAQYFALIGIDANDSAAVADFVGAREMRSQWLSSLERSAQLTPAQADIVASQLQIALRGNLQ